MNNISVYYQVLGEGTDSKYYDITDAVTSIQYETSFRDQPSSLTMDMVKDKTLDLPNGSVVSFKMGDIPVFLGFQFKVGKSSGNVVPLTFYDQMRYLQYQDSLVVGNKTIGQLFSQICMYNGLKYKVLDDSTYILPPKVYDKESYYKMLQDGIDLTFLRGGKMLMIRDNFGVLELVDVERVKTNKFIGDGSLMTSFEYEESIDGETYNVIRLLRENKETKAIEEEVLTDPSTIKYWGKLQMTETTEEGVNMKQHAIDLLRVHNREEKTMSLDAVGDITLRAGMGIWVGIGELATDIGGIKPYIIEKCTHTISDGHMMTLDLRMV